jgi:hypothetical protein
MEKQSFVTFSAAIRLAGRRSLRRDPGEILIRRRSFRRISILGSG